MIFSSTMFRSTAEPRVSAVGVGASEEPRMHLQTVQSRCKSRHGGRSHNRLLDYGGTSKVSLTLGIDTGSDPSHRGRLPVSFIREHRRFRPMLHVPSRISPHTWPLPLSRRTQVPLPPTPLPCALSNSAFMAPHPSETSYLDPPPTPTPPSIRPRPGHPLLTPPDVGGQSSAFFPCAPCVHHNLPQVISPRALSTAPHSNVPPWGISKASPPRTSRGQAGPLTHLGPAPMHVTSLHPRPAGHLRQRPKFRG